MVANSLAKRKAMEVIHLAKKRKAVKATPRTFGDLPTEITRRILTNIATSGAENFVRAIASSKDLKAVSEEEDILRAVNFDELLRSELNLVQLRHINGVLNKCAQAGNKKAMIIIAKIILRSSSQLNILEAAKVHIPELEFDSSSLTTFITYFMPYSLLPDQPKSKFLHYVAVKYFLQQATLYDLKEMAPYLNHYVHFFLIKRPGSIEKFNDWFDKLKLFSRLLNSLLSFGEIETGFAFAANFGGLKRDLLSKFDSAFKIKG